MLRRTVLAAALALTTLAGAAPALAQDYDEGRQNWRGQASQGQEWQGQGWQGQGWRGQDWRDERRDDDRGWGWGRRRMLPPRAIVGSLQRRGYRDIDIKRISGGSYVVEALGRRGRVLVVVDGRTTEITGLRVVGWDRPRPLYEDGGWNGPRPWSGPRW